MGQLVSALARKQRENMRIKANNAIYKSAKMLNIFYFRWFNCFIMNNIISMQRPNSSSQKIYCWKENNLILHSTSWCFIFVDLIALYQQYNIYATPKLAVTENILLTQNNPDVYFLIANFKYFIFVDLIALYEQYNIYLAAQTRSHRKYIVDTKQSLSALNFLDVYFHIALWMQGN